MTKKTVAVIPAFNEEKKIKEVIEETKKYVDGIIVVDDGSTDQTFETAKKSKATLVLKHALNLGKGAVLRTGCEAALRLGADVIITLDGDGQHNPAEIPKFLKKLNEEELDIVFGSRLLGKQMPLTLKAGNKVLSKTSKILFGVDIYDTQSGYRAFTAEAYKKIEWSATDYSAETEMISKVGKKNLKYGEIFIETIYHNPYKGTTIIDGMKIFANMLIWKVTK